jgi:uncharacterized protein (DUF736 family)
MDGTDFAGRAYGAQRPFENGMAVGKGLISTIERDLDIAAVPFSSDNEKAPTHRVYAKAPRGHDIEVGGIWKRRTRRASHTTRSRSSASALTPISAASRARTTRLCRRSSNGNPAINRCKAPGQKPGAHFRNAENHPKVLDFQHFSC